MASGSWLPRRRALGALAAFLLAVGGLLLLAADGAWPVIGSVAVAAVLTAEGVYWLMVVLRRRSGSSA